MCVLLQKKWEEYLNLYLTREGNLLFRTDADENDLLYDDIAMRNAYKEDAVRKKESCLNHSRNVLQSIFPSARTDNENRKCQYRK